MRTESTSKLCIISRVQFFDIAAAFPFIRDRLRYAGSLHIIGLLFDDEIKRINAVFPNTIREA